MAPPAWLPPLNSHPNSITRVKIRESATQLVKDEEVAGRQFFIMCHVYVDFFSDRDVRRLNGFPGFFARATKYSADVKNNPEAFVCDILDDDLVPFPIDHSVWIEEHLNGGVHLSGEEELAAKLLDFVLRVDGKAENADLDVVTAVLDIDRSVFVPDDEFRSWVSWFDEQRRVYPNFNTEYSRAISKPRDRAVAYEEAAAAAAKRPAGRWLAGEMESVVVKDEKSSCSICLEEFSDGACVARLPCGHLFDEDCILRWLSENSVCPFCRRQFSVD